MVLSETDASRRLASLGIATEELTEAAARALSSAAGLAPAGGGGADAPRVFARVSVGRFEARAGAPGAAPIARVLVALELSPVGDGVPIREIGVGEESLGGPEAGLERAVHGAVERAIEDAARQVGLQRAAAAKDDRALVDDLSAADPATRDHAVRALAARRNTAAVPRLIERLSDPDPDVADRAVGALVEIGDPRAVPALIDLAHQRGGRSVADLVHLVGELGGPVAHAWLETLEAGHPDREVRLAAAEALDELRRRDARPTRAASR